MDEVDPKYLIPLFDRIFCCLPASWRRTLRCNRNFPKPEVLILVLPVMTTICVSLISAFTVTPLTWSEKDALKPSDTKQSDSVDQTWALLVLLTSLFFELVS